MSHTSVEPVVTIAGIEVVNGAVYNKPLREIELCHELLDRYGVPEIDGNLATRIEATLMLMKYSDIEWRENITDKECVE